MTMLTVKNAHKLDLDMLCEDELRKLAANLIRSRQDRKTAEQKKQEFLADQVEKQGKINRIMMPQIATLLEALAERAGLSNQPSVQAAIKAVGEQAHTQWSGDVEDLPDLAIDPEMAEDPRAGDAEMVLSAKIDASIQVLKSALDFGELEAHIATAVRNLVDGIDAHMEEAIANGFKARGVDWKPVPRPKSMNEVEVSEQALSALLYDLATDIDFGTQLLRLDLRAGMYRNLTEGLILAGRISHELHHQKMANRTPEELAADCDGF